MMLCWMNDCFEWFCLWLVFCLLVGEFCGRFFGVGLSVCLVVVRFCGCVLYRLVCRGIWCFFEVVNWDGCLVGLLWVLLL